MSDLLFQHSNPELNFTSMFVVSVVGKELLTRLMVQALFDLNWGKRPFCCEKRNLRSHLHRAIYIPVYKLGIINWCPHWIEGQTCTFEA